MIVYIKNKIISLGEGSDVLDEKQQPIFKIKGKVFSITRKKMMYDMEGKLLYTIRNKFWTMFSDKVLVKDAEGNLVATIKKGKWSFNAKYEILNTDNDMSIDGKFFNRTSRIMKNGQAVATITREFTLIRDAFSLEAEEQDIPFFTALVVAFDNLKDKIRNDKK